MRARTFDARLSFGLLAAFVLLLSGCQLFRPKPEPPDAKAVNRRKLDEAFDASEEASRRKPWLAPTEAQNSGFMDDFEVNTKPGFEATKPQLQDDESNASASRTGSPATRATSRFNFSRGPVTVPTIRRLTCS